MNDGLLERLISQQTKKPEEYSPLLLAYIGDAVYEVFVRTSLIKRGNLPVDELHRLSKHYVSAAAQSEIIEKLELNQPQIFKSSLKRENLSYNVFLSTDKKKDLIYYLKKLFHSFIILK